jgi:hypothetical protein
MASLFWSWIFIIQLFLVRPGFARVSGSYEVLAQRALENVFIRGLSKAEKTRNTYMALAIAGGVVLIAGFVGLYLLYRRQRQKVPEPESGAIDKPHWFMVDGKNDKMDWWKLSNKVQEKAKLDAELPEGSRIERLKAALNMRPGKKQQPLLPIHRDTKSSPTESIALPMQTDPEMQHRYPDVLERGYRAPIYPVQSPPQVPALTRTMYDGDKAGHPRSPPKALVTQGLTRSIGRSVDRRLPRSPAGRRKSWLTRGNQFRHPFLPLKDSDAPLPTISAPVPITVDPSNPKLNYSVSIGKPRAAPVPPPLLVPPVPPKGGARRPPAPLQLAPGSADIASARHVRFGLPTSPRPARNQSPAI